MSTFETSEQWIRANRTQRGGWTRRQLAIFGEDWPPRPGWIKRAIGRVITVEQRQIFEGQGRRRQPQQNRLFEAQQ